tara:strand:- start:70 stop:480 length:411 start_codon:yes stop_codon:yes gene_type:complete
MHWGSAIEKLLKADGENRSELAPIQELVGESVDLTRALSAILNLVRVTNLFDPEYLDITQYHEAAARLESGNHSIEDLNHLINTLSPTLFLSALRAQVSDTQSRSVDQAVSQILRAKEDQATVDKLIETFRGVPSE